MPPIKAIPTAGAVLTGIWLLAGCGGSKPVAPASDAASSAPALTLATLPEKAPAAPPPPPPGETAVVAANRTPAQPQNPATAPIQLGDGEGNQVTGSLAIMQRAVDIYSDRRFSSVDDENDKAWPPLSDLSQLVHYKILPRLPAPPAGQKFVLDLKTHKVSLAAK